MYEVEERVQVNSSILNHWRCEIRDIQHLAQVPHEFVFRNREVGFSEVVPCPSLSSIGRLHLLLSSLLLSPLLRIRWT
jgi:hypothetical protein